MNANVHYWIVVDAVEYVRQKGTAREKQAFQAWETAWGGGSLDTTAPYESRIEDIVGHESTRTDYYQDMALDLMEFSGRPWGTSTQFAGLSFTAWNHFLAVPWKPTAWSGTDGYQFGLSAKDLADLITMIGPVDLLNTQVNIKASPILPKCDFWWTGSDKAWEANWEADIRDTFFVPASVLASYYYESLLTKRAVQVVVNGKTYGPVHGIFLLGPVAHSVADACVPHHVISTLGFWHQIWEHMVETGVSVGNICLDSGLVENMLRNEMKRVECTGGRIPGALAVEKLVHVHCGWKTYTEFLRMAHIGGPKEMESESFWFKYMFHLSEARNHAEYFYNLAVAATIRVITESYYDLAALTDAPPGSPVILGLQDYKVKKIGPKKTCDSGKKTLLARIHDILQATVDLILGFQPRDFKAAGEFESLQKNLEDWNKKKLSDQEILLKLEEFEKNLEHQYGKMPKKGLDRFATAPAEFGEPIDQLREAFGLPPVSADRRLKALFGLATVPPPDSDQYEDTEKLEKYLKSSQDKELNASLIATTRSIALLKDSRREAKKEQLQNIDRAIQDLEQRREVIIRTKAIPSEIRAAKAPPLKLIPVESRPLPVQCEESDPE